jgi:hypothetical protein
MGVSASCERRLEVRALEWRRFGFGIADSFQAFSQTANPGIYRDAPKRLQPVIAFQLYVFILLRRSASAAHRASV